MKIKRIIAYAIDYMIIMIIGISIFEFGFKNNYEQFTEKSEQFVESMNLSESNGLSLDESNKFYYELSKIETPLLITNFGLTVLYFGIFSFIANGKTIGKRILKIRVVPVEGDKLNPGLYFLREIILTNSVFNLLSILSISLCGMDKWITFNSLISNGKLFVTIALIVVLIFREDERSIHDIISNTKVIEEK